MLTSYKILVCFVYTLKFILCQRILLLNVAQWFFGMEQHNVFLKFVFKTLIYFSPVFLIFLSLVFEYPFFFSQNSLSSSLRRNMSEILCDLSSILWLYYTIWLDAESINNSLMVNILAPSGNYLKCDFFF